MPRIRVLRWRTVAIVLVSLLIAFCFIVYGGLIRGTAGNSVPHSLAAESVTPKLEVEFITLQTNGFEPVEIVSPKGPFVLLVDDRSGKESSSFSLERLQGEKLRDINTRRTKSEWHDVINLPPGNYLLTDAGNPHSRCQITITP